MSCELSCRSFEPYLSSGLLSVGASTYLCVFTVTVITLTHTVHADQTAVVLIKLISLCCERHTVRTKVDTLSVQVPFFKKNNLHFRCTSTRLWLRLHLVVLVEQEEHVTPKPDVKGVCPVNEHCDENFALLLTKGFCLCCRFVCLICRRHSSSWTHLWPSSNRWTGLFIKQFPSSKTGGKSLKK